MPPVSVSNTPTESYLCLSFQGASTRQGKTSMGSAQHELTNINRCYLLRSFTFFFFFYHISGQNADVNISINE